VSTLSAKARKLSLFLSRYMRKGCVLMPYVTSGATFNQGKNVTPRVIHNFLG